MRLALLAASLLLAAASAPAAAQLIPGGAPADTKAHRRVYLAQVYSDVESALGEWRSAWERDDVRRVMDFYTDDAVFFPARGDMSQGKGAVRGTLEALLPVASSLRSTMLDFTASGDLAYYAGRFTYLVAPRDEDSRLEEGLFVMVLVNTGRGWRIRSHVEQPEQRPHPAESAAGAGPAAN